MSESTDTPAPAQPKRRGRPAGKKNSNDLMLHPNGQYYKSIRGQVYYFGRDYRDALARFRRESPALYAGKKASTAYDPGRPLVELVDLFLDDMEAEFNGGQLKYRSYDGACQRLTTLVKYLGEKTPMRDITTVVLKGYRKSLLKDQYAPKTVNNLLQAMKALFKWGKADRYVLEVHEDGPDQEAVKWCIVPEVDRQTFTPEEFRKLVDAATGQVKAMIYLGLNAGFGRTDCSEVEWKRFDFAGGFVHFPRPKTGVPRDFNLWDDTVAALQAVPERPKLGPHVFYTDQGNLWVRPNPGGHGTNDEVSKAFHKVAKKAGVKLEPGNAFYAPRRTAATVAAETGDAFAVMRILGHRDLTMATKYVQNRKRKCVNALRAVEHISNWYRGVPAYLSQTQVMPPRSDSDD